MYNQDHGSSNHLITLQIPTQNKKTFHVFDKFMTEQLYLYRLIRWQLGNNARLSTARRRWWSSNCHSRPQPIAGRGWSSSSQRAHPPLSQLLSNGSRSSSGTRRFSHSSFVGHFCTSNDRPSRLFSNSKKCYSRSMISRFKSQGKSLYQFYDTVLIHCPKCDKKAIIRTTEKDKKQLTCTSCPYTKKGSLPIHTYFPKLWLRSRCGRHELWALNADHLLYIKEYVSAKIRERTKDPQTGWANQSLESRLPQWIKSAKNRDQVLKCIKKLEEKLWNTTNFNFFSPWLPLSHTYNTKALFGGFLT